MPIDRKYGSVVTQHGNFHDDEIVVVFRASDKFLPAVLDAYFNICEAESPDHHLDAIIEAREGVITWQDENKEKVRTPNSNAYYERVKNEGSS